LNSERARCGAIRNLRKPEYELVIHKSLVIVYNYLMPHQSLKTGEVEFGLTNRKEIMQNEPRESNENNFMALLNFIVDPAVIVDGKGYFLLVNNAFEDLTGLSDKDVIGTPFLEVKLLTAESKALLLKNLMKRMQGLPVEPYEIAFTDKNGENRYTEVKAKTMDYAGQHADLVIFRDITRRKKNLAKLKEYSEKMEKLVNEKVKDVKESEEKYRELTESISDVFFAMDKDLRYTYWNKASEKLTGIPSKDAIGKSLTEIFPNVNGTRIEQFYQEVLRTKQPQSFLNNYEVGDKEFVFEISAYPTMAGLSVFVKDITERKQAEENLEKEQQELDCIVDSSPIIIFYKDKEGKFIRVNKTFAEALKIPKEKFLGKTVFDFYSAKIAQGMTNDDLEVLKSGRPKLGIIEQYKSASGMRWVQTDKVPIFDKNGIPVGLVGFAQDITEQKKAEEKLRKSEKSWSDSFNSLEDVMIIIGKDYTIEKMNDSGLKLLGKTREEITGKKCYQVIHGLDAPCEVCSFKRTLKTGKMESVDRYIELFDKYFSIKSSSISNERGEIVGFADLMRDISERKKMEATIKQERDMLESVTENIGAGFINISKDYRVLWANEFIRRYKGDVEGKLCYATLNTLDHICPDCGVKKVFEDGVTLDTHEYNSTDIKGNDYWVELIATPIKDKDGNVIAALELAVDITKKKRMQRELAEYSQKLEQLVAKRTEELEQTQAKLLKTERLAVIGELAAIIGHDLRNPLTGIKGATYYLKNKYGAEMDVKGKEMLETVDSAIDYSNKIINDLIDYSRDLTLELVNTTPKLLLKNALSLIEVPERIKIIDATQDKPNIKADTGNMSKVFVNIITNAIDAMPETGTLTVTSKAVKGNVEIAFKDTGTGMPKETLSNIWSPLFTTKAKGMGFGLPVCKRIVEAHGGKISVESTLGKGTTVTITIPVNPQPVDEGEEKWIFNESWLSATPTAEGAP
jgi:PAS domain S-box-containing protein